MDAAEKDDKNGGGKRLKVLAASLIMVNILINGYAVETLSTQASHGRRFEREQEIWDSGSVLLDRNIPPDFDVPLAGGGRFHLADRMGKSVVILYFFEPWKEKTGMGLEQFARLQRRFDTPEVVILAVVRPEKEDAALAAMKEAGARFPLAIDTDRKVHIQYAVSEAPALVVIGAADRDLDGSAQNLIHGYRNGFHTNLFFRYMPWLQSQIQMIREGKGVTKEDYLLKLEKENIFKQREKENRLAQREANKSLLGGASNESGCGL